MAEEKFNEADFIATARKRFEASAADEKEIRDEALTDLKFVAGDQWDPKLKQDRERAGRPALTFPRCHTFVQQVSNDARQNKPQIKFAPTDDHGDDDTAEIAEGLARHIQYASDAQVAYETAVEYSAGGGFGYYRFVTDYVDDDSDDVELKILPVLDPFAVYGILIPNCFGREPRYGFVVEDVPEEEFKDQYPKSPITTGTLSNSDEGWLKDNGWRGTDTVRKAEYWYCESYEEQRKGVSGKYVGRRSKTITKTRVKFCQISGMEVLPDTTTVWPGYCIPIIPVLGKQMIVRGKAQLFSVVRFQRSAQQMINYAKTRIAETLSSAPVSPFIVAAGQIPKGDKKWENLNTQNFPYLEYNQVDSSGKPAPPPQRQVYEPPIQALQGFTLSEIDDMKATTGIFDASLGQKSNETSGTAIRNRQQQANMTTMHFMDNLERAFKKGGLIMEDVFPKIYDTERIIHILGRDETAKIVKINQQYIAENGQPKHHKLGGDDAGKYKAIVTMGRAFSTKRQETFDMMQQLVQSAPDLLPMFGDVMFQNSDAAGADIVAERFKKMLPPNLQDQESGDPEQQLQQMQAQLAQMKQAHDALNAYAQQLEKEKEGKVVENQAKATIAQMQEMSKQEIVRMQEATKLAVAQINASKDANQAYADRELEQYKILHQSAHDAGMAAEQRGHDATMASRQMGHESQMAEKNATLAAQQSEITHSQNLEAQQQAADSAGDKNA